MNEIHLLLEKAARSLDVAKDLLREGHSDFATSRTYYACFYTAQALLLSKDLEFSSHSQVIAQYGYHFSRTKILSPEYHRLLAKAFDFRNLADYQTEVALSAEAVEELIERGREFLRAASSYLGDPPGDEETSGEAESGESGAD
ncbi:MAG TPA: HEPN domain-containing protein [Thermoanaerobaculia bacterium]|jgi:uncharacterized protein (UPF0332 family)|nr:HEPN domain-containing protein [Thermoanaerobaculia bacterium]